MFKIRNSAKNLTFVGTDPLQALGEPTAMKRAVQLRVMLLAVYSIHYSEFQICATCKKPAREQGRTLDSALAHARASLFSRNLLAESKFC